MEFSITTPNKMKSIPTLILLILMCMEQVKTAEAGSSALTQYTRSHEKNTLIQKLKTVYRLKPRLNDEGDLHAVYGIKGEMEISDAVWQALVDTPSLRHVQAVRLSMEDVSYIGEMNQLTYLNLSGGSLDFDAAMAHIGKLEHLEELNLHHSRNFSGEGCRHLPKLQNLRHLVFHNIRPFNAEGIIESVAQLPNLRSLHLTALIHLPMTSLEPLRGHPKLESLIYPQQDEIPQFLDLLSSMPSINEVMILSKPGELQILNEDCINGLLKLDGLETIEMHNVTLSERDYEKLSEKFSDAQIELWQRESYHATKREVVPFDDEDLSDTQTGE